MRCLNLLLAVCCSLIGVVPAASVSGDDKLSPEQLNFFESKIRPVLVRECYSCHSAKVGAVKGGLWLDTKEGMHTGGDSGPAIVPGELDDSLLWGAINHTDFVMPPRKKLSADTIADFRKWIEMGAPDPRTSTKEVVNSSITAEDIERGRQFWSFQPVQQVAVPELDSNWPISNIDKFVLAGLNQQQLQPNVDAEPQQVLRRLTVSLVGLPPTLEQIEWFQQRWKVDPDQAISGLTDELLASDQFGERWGRHWLDVARFAESTGREQNLTYPQAWRYRDYVIDSFNQDKPYDQFLREQIAGDLLPVDSDQQWTENLVATGFLAVGPKAVTEQNGRQFQNDLIDEQIDVTTRVMLGVSVACARCHDHKFDPIPQTDYYALAGIFGNMTTHYGTVNGFANRRPSNLLIMPVEDLSPFDQPVSTEHLDELRQQLEDKRQDQREAIMQRRQRRNGNDDGQNILNAIRIAAEIGIIQDQLNRYDENGQPYSLCMGVQETDRITNARLLERGEFDKPAQEVSRGLPQVLCQSQPEIGSAQSGRLELANWIGSDQNPLTARVMVNRIWLKLLGSGLVRTPENFGATGQPPTHPELLDYLAGEFVRNNWSTKQLIRQIVTSRVFRVSSRFDEVKFQSDPENKLLWRFEPRRVEAEVLRDSMLAASGALDKNRPRASMVAAAGTAVVRDGVLVDVAASPAGMMNDMQNRPGSRPANRGRAMQRRANPIDQAVDYRSVYLPVVRDQLPRAMEVFDFAEPTMVVGQRESSNTPDQGLFLLNNEFVIAQCDQMAERLLEYSDDPSEQLERAYLLIYGRTPTASEKEIIRSFYRTFSPVASRYRRDSKNIPLKKISAICQSLMASAEFRYLD